MNIKVTQASWHRNGISGVGFYAVLFEADPNKTGEEQRFFAALFDEPGYCAVISLDLIDECGVAFGRGNSWRGDHFESELREAIERGDGADGVRMGAFSLPPADVIAAMFGTQGGW